MMRGAAAALSVPASFSGRNTLPNTVAQGISVGSWNTKPMPRLRAAPSLPGHRAARRLAQARDDAERRRLAAAGRAEQRQEFAVEIEPSSAESGAEHLPTPRSETMGAAKAPSLFPQAVSVRNDPALDLGLVVAV